MRTQIVNRSANPRLCLIWWGKPSPRGRTAICVDHRRGTFLAVFIDYVIVSSPLVSTSGFFVPIASLSIRPDEGAGTSVPSLGDASCSRPLDDD